VYRVRMLRPATRDLCRLDAPTARRIVERLNWLVANVGSTRHEALAGDLAGFLKLRVGDYRVVCELLDDERTILVHAIDHRRRIYRER